MVIDALADLNPHFNKLRNAVLRKLLAGRVTIEDACKISGCRVEDFLLKMAEIGFDVESKVNKVDERNTEYRTVIYRNLKERILDVRPILANKEDPLKYITKIISDLREEQCLKLITSFEPIPLISLLTKKGFSYHTERPEPDMVITWFVKTDAANPKNQAGELTMPQNQGQFDLRLNSFIPDKLETIDVRELEMPLPMLTILGHLENLSAGKALFVLHKKVPVYLLPELKERGFQYLLQEIGDEKVNMLIYKL